MNLDDYAQWFEQESETIRRDYYNFLRFKSISSEPAFQKDVRACCEWLAHYLEKMGLTVHIWEGSGHPVIFATLASDQEDAPTLLIYNHYDVQPVDPLELWQSDPFEPEEREGRVYARGAQDNKGQCFYSLTALRAWLQLGQKRPFNLKIVIEGEEEVGSRSLPELLIQKREELRADHLLVVDVGLPAKDVPAVTLGMRGIITFDIKCLGANCDLHSGHHGGLAYNPNKALVQLFSKLWTEDGRIAIEAIYDDLDILDKRELKLFDLDFDEEDYQKKFGVRALDVESGISPIESNWLRPTLEINGIIGGYTGEGFKTIIPAQASAKLSCRLPPNLKPDKVSQQIIDFLQKNCPEGMELEIEAHGGGPGLRTLATSEIVQIASKAYEAVYQSNCRMILTGGSIPIIVSLAEASEAQVALIGTGLGEDNIHSPNESFGWNEQFKRGFLVMTQIFEQLS
jgi:acetylornithine deacetylase/succinyl-diaminopimelate desuccinylase-like protein